MSNINVKDIIYGQSTKRANAKIMFPQVNFTGAIASANSRNQSIMNMGTQIAQAGTQVYDRFSRLAMQDALIDAKQENAEAAKKAERDYNAYLEQHMDPTKAADIVSDEYRKEVDANADKYRESIAPYLQGDFDNEMKNFNANQELMVQDHVLKITDKVNQIHTAEATDKAANRGDPYAVMEIIRTFISQGGDRAVGEQMMIAGVKQAHFIRERKKGISVLEQLQADGSLDSWEEEIVDKISHHLVVAPDISEKEKAEAMRDPNLVAAYKARGINIARSTLGEGEIDELKTFFKQRVHEMSAEKHDTYLDEISGEFQKGVVDWLVGDNVPATAKEAENIITSILDKTHPDGYIGMLGKDETSVEEAREKTIKNFVALWKEEKDGDPAKMDRLVGAYNLEKLKEAYNIARVLNDREAAQNLEHQMELQYTAQFGGGKSYMTAANYKEGKKFIREWSLDNKYTLEMDPSRAGQLRGYFEVMLAKGGILHDSLKQYLEERYPNADIDKDFREAQIAELTKQAVAEVDSITRSRNEFTYQEAINQGYAQLGKLLGNVEGSGSAKSPLLSKKEMANFMWVDAAKNNMLQDADIKVLKDVSTEEIENQLSGHGMTYLDYEERASMKGSDGKAVTGLFHFLYQDEETGEKYWAVLDKSLTGLRGKKEGVDIYLQPAKVLKEAQTIDYPGGPQVKTDAVYKDPVYNPDGRITLKEFLKEKGKKISDAEAAAQAARDKAAQKKAAEEGLATGIGAGGIDSRDSNEGTDEEKPEEVEEDKTINLDEEMFYNPPGKTGEENNPAPGKGSSKKGNEWAPPF